MVIIITGSSHTGKTLLAQKLLEKYHYPYLSIDHLKMGLIRSGQTNLTPTDDEELEKYLWPILREIIKTATENQQNLIIEGCYIPFHWKSSFEATVLEKIQYICLILTENYIRNHFDDILSYSDIIEKRTDDSYLKKEFLIAENSKNQESCEKYHLPYYLIDEAYPTEIDFSSLK